MSNAIQFKLGTVSIQEGETTGTISISNEFFDRGTALFVSGAELPVEATRQSGTSNEIRLIEPWPYSSVTDANFVAFNTIEGLADTLRFAGEITEGLQALLDVQSDLLTSTEETITVELPDGDIEVTPWGYVLEQVQDQMDAQLSEQEGQFNTFLNDAQDELELARDTAFVQADLYGTVAEGESDTASGDFFWVLSEDGNLTAELYLNDDGTGVAQDKSIVSRKFVDAARLESSQALSNSIESQALAMSAFVFSTLFDEE